MMWPKEYTKRFTVVFEGDVRKLPFNPLNHLSEWGKPIGIAAGDRLIDEDDEQDFPPAPTPPADPAKSE